MIKRGVSTLSAMFTGCRPVDASMGALVDKVIFVVDTFDKSLARTVFRAGMWVLGSSRVRLCRLCRSRLHEQRNYLLSLFSLLFPVYLSLLTCAQPTKSTTLSFAGVQP